MSKTTPADAKAAATKSMRANEAHNAGTSIELARNNILAIMEKNKDQIRRALPAIGLTQDRLIRIALTAMSKNPRLFDCTPASLLGSVIQSAQLGLECDGMLGQAALVPFRNNKANRLEAQLMIMYQGFITLVDRGGSGYNIYAQVVYVNDDFDYQYGTDPYLRHRPAEKERGEVRGFYSVALNQKGSKLFEFMTKEQVDKIRNQSQGKDSDAWKYHYDEQGRKTVVRRLMKYIPKSSNLQIAARLDDLHAEGMSQGLDVTKLSVEQEGGRDVVVMDLPEPEEKPKTVDAPGTSEQKPAEATFTEVKENKEKAEPPTATGGPIPTTEGEKPREGARLPANHGEKLYAEYKAKVEGAKSVDALNKLLAPLYNSLNTGDITQQQFDWLFKSLGEATKRLKDAK